VPLLRGGLQELATIAYGLVETFQAVTRDDRHTLVPPDIDAQSGVPYDSASHWETLASRMTHAATAVAAAPPAFSLPPG